MASESYSSTAPRITDPKRVKWAKWLIKRSGDLKWTNTIRQIQAKILATY